VLTGKEFQRDGAATENARQGNLVCVRGSASSEGLAERSDRGGTWLWIKSFKYAGVVCDPQSPAVSLGASEATGTVVRRRRRQHSQDTNQEC